MQTTNGQSPGRTSFFGYLSGGRSLIPSVSQSRQSKIVVIVVVIFYLLFLLLSKLLSMYVQSVKKKHLYPDPYWPSTTFCGMRRRNVINSRLKMAFSSKFIFIVLFAFLNFIHKDTNYIMLTERKPFFTFGYIPAKSSC